MIICVGEILADMITKETDEGVCFGRYAGGAPFNVACGIAKLGGEVGFYGCVGDDLVGDFLTEYAAKQDFSYCNIIRNKEKNTTLSFVVLDADGDRKFCFYRKNTADYCLCVEDISEIVAKSDMIHLGSLPLSEEQGRNFYDKLIVHAKAKGIKISFDVNYRDDVFANECEAKAVYSKYIQASDIVKFSEDELTLFTGEKGIRKGAEKIVCGTDKIVFVTLGKNGSAVLSEDKFIEIPALKVKAKDTTGAGDAFFAGVLSVLSKSGISHIEEALSMGNICGSLTTLKKGAIDAFPSQDEIVALLNGSR